MKKLTLLALSLPLAMTFGINEANAAGLGVHGTFALPTGDFGDLAGVGFGGGVSWTRELNNKMTYGGKVSYLTFGSEKIGPFEYSYSMIPVVAKANYYFGGNEEMRFYGSLSAGYYFVSVDFDNGFGSSSSSSGEIGFAPGVGMEMGKLDFNAEYHLVDGSNLTYFGINVGYNF